MRRSILAWTGAGIVAVACLAIGLAQPSQASPAALRPLLSPGSTITLQIPAACLSSTATHRTYPLSLPQADGYARSGEHGHGKLTCIVFMTRTYSKVLVVDQAAGGYTIGGKGLDVTYVDCGLPGYRFPPPPFTGANDCGESWGASEGAWVYQSGPAQGQPMFPPSTP